MRRILLDDKLPYLLTLVIAAASFQFNYVVQLILSEPVIEYATRTVPERPYETMGSLSATQVKALLSGYPPKTAFVCTVTNISRAAALRQVRVYFPAKADESIGEADIDVVPPSAQGNVDFDLHSQKRAVEYTIERLQPGFVYGLYFTVCGLKSDPATPEIFLQSEDAFRLRPVSVRTWIVKRQLEINVGLLSFLVVVGLLYSLRLEPK